MRRFYYGVSHQELILSEAGRQSLSPYLIAAIIYTESRFRSDAVSEVGARGLMQLMPDTARELAESEGIVKFDETFLNDPALNIRLGTRYLAQLNRQFASVDDAIVAYNAGPATVSEWKRKNSKIDYPETLSYLENVKYYEQLFEALYPDWVQKPDRDS